MVRFESLFRMQEESWIRGEHNGSQEHQSGAAAVKQLRNDSGFSGDGGSGTEKKKEGSITRVKSEIEQSEFAELEKTEPG